MDLIKLDKTTKIMEWYLKNRKVILIVAVSYIVIRLLSKYI
jgi:hypothetical protein